ncbi:riboflavin synthase subunit alpha [Pseudoalteromonas mariniglutinosa]|uniref:riboflavin synthase subunit alpha n=1 Tax=Pseudoalteromonas mariniglutinosa TaxID=206042 RepID=UPI00384DAE20
MFTGIIQTQARVVSAQLMQGVLRLKISVAKEFVQHLELGASIAINGCCLTVVAVDDDKDMAYVSFDIIDETLQLTNLGAVTESTLVNFERSLTFGAELGGHIVSGHIHCVASITDIIKQQNNYKMHLKIAKKWQKYVLYKGFVCVNGASLTVGELDDDGFWLHLIPETLALTNLAHSSIGEQLNIEVDQQTYTIINTVENYMRRYDR